MRGDSIHEKTGTHIKINPQNESSKYLKNLAKKRLSNT